jgi:hypothetical protein
MADVLVLALAAALNPTLVAASTLMMVLPNPRRLMLGYLLGALMTSITLGLVIVFSIEGSGAVSTTKRTLSPVATMVLGALALVGASVLGGQHLGRTAERRRAAKGSKKEKGPPRWQRALGRGSARVTFLVGALLTLPGASYLAGLVRIDKLNAATAPTVLLIVVFNLIMLALLEVPLVSFVVAPDWTPRAIERSKAWIRPRARRFAVSVLTVIGALLLLKGLIELLS